MIMEETANVKITKDMLIGDILAMDMTIAPILMASGMHCVGCAMASGETIEQACAAHGVDPDEFLVYLEKFLQTV